MIQGPSFLIFFKKIHQWLRDNSKVDGKGHVILFNGHASHMNLYVIKFAITNNLVIFQFPSHSSRVMQPLDV